MIGPWTRRDTQFWIKQLENRLEDIDYYLGRTVEWCEENGIYRDDSVFACALMTVLWVSHHRGEPLSKREAMELLNVEGWDMVADEEFVLDQRFDGIELEELLEQVCQKLF